MQALRNQTGFRHAVVAASLVIFISLLTNFQKELFVSETGHMQVFGGGLGVILAVGLVLRWRFAHSILAVITVFGFVLLSLFTLFDLQSPKLFARLWLLVLYGTATYLLLGSKELQAYSTRGKAVR